MELNFEVQVSDATVEIADDRYGLRVAAVWRKNTRDLGDQWKSAGVYILLGTPETDGGWSAYVGKAKDLNARLGGHRAGQEREFDWIRAVLVRRLNGFDTTESGWLEGRMHRLLEVGGVDLKNVQKPGDDTLKAAKRSVLESYLKPIRGVLMLLGYDFARHEEHEQHISNTKRFGATTRNATTLDPRPKQEPDRKTPTTSYMVGKLLHSVDDLEVGSQLESTPPTYAGATATVDAVGIRYSGETYTSLSAAAKAVTGTDTADGWSFWGTRTKSGELVSLKRLRSEAESRRRRVPGRSSAANDRRPAKAQPRRARPTTSNLVDKLLRSVPGIEIGSQLESTPPTYAGATATVDAVGIRYSGETYTSLSAAAKAVTGTDTADGWSFWGTRTKSDELVSLKRLRSEAESRRRRVPGRSSAANDRRPAKAQPRRARPTTSNLIDKLLRSVPGIEIGSQLESTPPTYAGATATVDAVGIRYSGETYTSLSAAAKAVTGTDTADGWSFWGIRTESGLKRLKDLRERS